MFRNEFLKVLFYWLFGLVVLFASEMLTRVGGIVGANAGALPAAYFLLTPLFWAKRQGIDPATLGISAGRLMSALSLVLVTTLVVFPPYILAFQLWSAWTNAGHLCVPNNVFAYYESSARGNPNFFTDEPCIHVWMEGEFMYAMSTASTRLEIKGCSCPTLLLSSDKSGQLRFHNRQGACDPISVDLEPGRGVACGTAHSGKLLLNSNPELPWCLGYAGVMRKHETLVLDRTLLWFPELLLIQIFGIALPEEVFYRGFVQGRLSKVFRRRVAIFGTPVGLHVVLASLLFALSHLVTQPHPFRLAVFFPGLLFGWMRERTGAILAPVLFHAACNILLEILVRFRCL